MNVGYFVIQIKLITKQPDIERRIEMTKQEAIESMVKDVRKHLEEYEYCAISIVRKGEAIKANINIFEGDFETVTSTSGTTIRIDNLN